MDAAQKADANAMRTAFGADYEQRLRQEAGARPDKLSKRKHQISSLYHQAKIQVRPSVRLCPGCVTVCQKLALTHNCWQELELLEKRTQSMKSKAQTQAKYGW